jgi:hypothetical protein
MAKDANEVRRRIAFDTETYLALDRLAKDRMSSLQELADEAFRDLLRKHRQPVTLKEMRRESARQQPANDHEPRAGGDRPEMFSRTRSLLSPA